MRRINTERRFLPRFKNRGLAPSNVSNPRISKATKSCIDIICHAHILENICSKKGVRLDKNNILALTGETDCQATGQLSRRGFMSLSAAGLAGAALGHRLIGQEKVDDHKPKETPPPDIKTNVEGTYNVLEAARDQGLNQVVISPATRP